MQPVKVKIVNAWTVNGNFYRLHSNTLHVTVFESVMKTQRNMKELELRLCEETSLVDDE